MRDVVARNLLKVRLSGNHWSSLTGIRPRSKLQTFAQERIRKARKRF
jgi:hypothetical protein